jgi:hypothetical protein
MRIIENFIPDSYKKELYDNLSGNNFGWFYEKGTVYTKTNSSLQERFGDSIVLDEMTEDNSQFTHVFFSSGQLNSALYNLVKPMFYFLEQQGLQIKAMKRIKANMMTRDRGFPENSYNIAHIDVPKEEYGTKAFTFLYYVNDSDGDTYLFNEKYDPFQTSESLTIQHRITPKAGTGILFDSYQYHASSPPRVSPMRMVINYVIELE